MVAIMKKLISKIAGFIFNVIGLPYNIAKKLTKFLIKITKQLGSYLNKIAIIVTNTINSLLNILVKSIKGFVNSIIKLIKFVPLVIIYLAKWLVKAVKESIAQTFTLLGFFIAWLTLTGSAKDTVGVAIIVSTALWLLTIGLREE